MQKGNHIKSHLIRPATERDIESIMLIENDSFSESIQENESLFLERIRTFSDGFILLECEGEIAGYISTEIWNYREKVDHHTFTLGHSISDVHNPSGEELYISSMGLSDRFRGRGLGKILFQQSREYILKNHKNIKSEILIVSEDWKSAQRIYTSSGFSEVTRIAEFFANGNSNADGIVMRRKVNNLF